MFTLRKSLRKFGQILRKTLGRWRKAPKVPRLYRAQMKFRKRYPDYMIGTGSYGMPIVHDWNEGTTLVIGSYCSIADEVHIFLGGQHRIDWVSSYPFPAFIEEAREIEGYVGTRGDVVIGNDVWLASGCTILSGVTIGDGAVVVARAVVSRDVAPYSIVAGNPAKHVRYRFDQEIREALLASAWWTWPESELRHIASLLCSNDLRAFLAYAEARPPHETLGAKG
jgi:acetyltransferase-like isoleucine patch superfamily enzyme